MERIDLIALYKTKMKEDDLCSHIDNITEELIEYIKSYELKEYGNEVLDPHFLREMRVCILGAIRYKCQVETNNGTHKEMIDYLNNKGRTEFLNKVDAIYRNLKMSYFRKDWAIESAGGEIYLLNFGGCILNHSKHFFEICELLHEIGTARKNIERF